MLKDIFNEKNLAMLVFLAIAIGAYLTQGNTADKIIIPIISGICSFITGYVAGKASTPEETTPKNSEEKGA